MGAALGAPSPCTCFELTISDSRCVLLENTRTWPNSSPVRTILATWCCRYGLNACSRLASVHFTFVSVPIDCLSHFSSPNCTPRWIELVQSELQRRKLHRNNVLQYHAVRPGHRTQYDVLTVRTWGSRRLVPAAFATRKTKGSCQCHTLQEDLQTTAPNQSCMHSLVFCTRYVEQYAEKFGAPLILTGASHGPGSGEHRLLPPASFRSPRRLGFFA